MLRSSSLGDLAAALAKAQGEFLPIIKNKTVTVRGQTRDGRPFSYDFEYADLDAIIQATRAALAKHGLALTQVLGDNEVTTLLIHGESGEYIGEEVHFDRFAMTIGREGQEIKKALTWQEIGGQVTYIRRYSAGSILNLAAETDDDGGKTEGMDSKELRDRKRANEGAVRTQAAAEAEAEAVSRAPTDMSFEEADIVLVFKEETSIQRLVAAFNKLPADKRRPGTKIFAAFQARRAELKPESEGVA